MSQEQIINGIIQMRSILETHNYSLISETAHPLYDDDIIALAKHNLSKLLKLMME